MEEIEAASISPEADQRNEMLDLNNSLNCYFQDKESILKPIAVGVRVLCRIERLQSSTQTVFKFFLEQRLVSDIHLMTAKKYISMESKYNIDLITQDDLESIHLGKVR